jgi:flavin reductase (DIM6/NTAB) family NADH-FMN oxidoreductase RutF
VSDYSDLDVAPELVLLGGLVEADRSFAEAIEADPTGEDFRFAMRTFGTGVVMVTVEVDGRILGLTINACCSISARPPQVLISLAHSASCRDAILAQQRFGLSILAVEHRTLAELGAVPGGPKELDVFCDRLAGDAGPAAVAGALAHLDCSVAQTFEVADHTLVIGRVGQAFVRPQLEERARPLVYFDRTFHALGDSLADDDEKGG